MLDNKGAKTVYCTAVVVGLTVISKSTKDKCGKLVAKYGFGFGGNLLGTRAGFRPPDFFDFIASLGCAITAHRVSAQARGTWGWLEILHGRAAPWPIYGCTLNKAASPLKSRFTTISGEK